MFIGHFGAGLAAKKVAPRASLASLIAGSLLLDLVWPIFLLLGWESVRIDPGNTVVTPLDFVSYPISHSLVATLGWSAVAGSAYWILTRYGSGALAIGAAVTSHWVLDWLVHRPDLPLYPGGPKLGFGLWNSIPATLAAEAFFFVGGIWVYSRATQARSKYGQAGFWVFVAFIALVYASNLLGAPPPGPEAVAWVTLSLWLMVVWAWSFDRRREPRGATP